MENVHHPDGCDMTSPLHLLAGYSTPASYLMVQTLLAQGKDPNCKNEDGITPVHVAASRGNYETLKLLLSNGGDPTTKEVDGKTPSDLAADDGHIDCVRLLNWWRVETSDTPKKPIHIDASIAADERSPYTNKVISSPIAQIYNSPRFFASPLKDSTNSPKGQLDFKNRSSPVAIGESKINKSWRKIDLTEHVDDRYENKKGANSNVDRISLLTNDESPTQRENFIDRQSLITNDESPTHRQNFVEFHDRVDYVQFQTSNRSSPIKLPVRIRSPTKKIESPRKNPFFELSCCTTSCNSISSNEQWQSATNDDATPSVLNDTLMSTALFNADVSFETVFSEELSKILRINTSTPMPPANEKIPNVIESNKNDDVEAENTLKTILEQSLRRDRSEIENIDPKRLSFCKKLTDAELRSELTRNGYEVGPITNGTRWLYVRRLALTNADEAKNGSVPKYSVELEKIFRGTLNLLDAVVDEKEMCNFFESPEKHWREGRLKMSFCYLLLDPTTFSSVDVDQMDDENFLRTFVKSIFYVGKGKKSRPFQHLTDAARVINANHGNNIGPKIQKILHLWNIGEGVISLHVFQNTIPVEAYTREAAMIDAIGIHNLTNVKRGDYYGLPANWNVFKRRRFGAYLLKTAASILKLEGRRPLKLNDVVALEL